MYAHRRSVPQWQMKAAGASGDLRKYVCLPNTRRPTWAEGEVMGGTARWREQYERMKRWRARLGERTGVEEEGVDDFCVFFTCCFHLKN